LPVSARDALGRGVRCFLVGHRIQFRNK
jgi:hypothetical protein